MKATENVFTLVAEQSAPAWNGSERAGLFATVSTLILDVDGGGRLDGWMVKANNSPVVGQICSSFLFH
jgi:hypothetical protein